MTVNYNTYKEEKMAFFNKHNNDFRCETSSMDEYGRYWKTYFFEDGARWYEIMSPEYVTQVIEIKMCKVEVGVKMFRTEFWNTDSSIPRYYYEKF